MIQQLRVTRLNPDARLPRYMSDAAAGLDLSACIKAPFTIPPSARVLVPTGLSIQLPPGHEGQIRPRSGLAVKNGVTLLNTPGTIDEDYRGEVRVLLINLGHEPFTVEPGMRIAQLVVAPVTRVEVEEVQELDHSERGAGGFGSTGAK